jgi:hypothetical protein
MMIAFFCSYLGFLAFASASSSLGHVYVHEQAGIWEVPRVDLVCDSNNIIIENIHRQSYFWDYLCPQTGDVYHLRESDLAQIELACIPDDLHTMLMNIIETMIPDEEQTDSGYKVYTQLKSNYIRKEP